LADRFARYIEARDELIASAVQVYEVYRAVRRGHSEDRAIEAVSALRQAEIVPVDDLLALEAADLSLAHRLGMADALIYATAQHAHARLITKDADFDGLPNAVVVRA
jgi:toxin FitB